MSTKVATNKDFTHLHLHSSYSLLDGAIRIPDLMKHVKEQGMQSVAITDHGNMFGAIEFYKEARKHAVKPIIGCEFYVAPGSNKEKQNLESLADGNNYHLIILAQNRKGYENLIHLASRSYTEGFYRKPRIDYDLLSKHSDGLICLTACLGGEVQQKILKNKINDATALAGKLKEIFGRDRFYLEIQKHGLKEEEVVAKANLEIARKNDIQLCLTNDAHFLTKEHHEAQNILLRINQKKTMADELSFSFNSDFYVKNPQEMWELFPELPEAFYNTSQIAEMVDLNFDFGNPLLPRFDVPENLSLDKYLHKLAWEGLQKHYPQITPEIRARFDYEYETITKMDFSGYFLIVQDFINFAKKSGIAVGPGRGSAAGSIISYALGITDIDPLRFGLLFERFLNPDRKEMPDIDIDFCTDRREEVINYVRHKYGADKVGQIVTYGTMAARACLKDVARVLNIPFAEANQMSAMFPDGPSINIQEALTTSRDLKEYSNKGQTQKKLFQVALALEGNVRQTGVHAAGIVIAPVPLEDIIPMATVASRGTQDTKERVLVSQYDMESLTTVGLVKMDFLGLRNLSVIQETINIIEKRHNIKVVLENKKMDDPNTYKLIQSAELAGIFQLESSPGMKELVLKMKPECFEDLIALIALFRPGPLQSGMAELYVKRKRGTEKLVLPHPDLKEILESTYGVILYQEQVMQISQKIGGFTPSQADDLRKAMGKKIHEKMQALRLKFIEGAVENNYKQKFAEKIYDQMAEFASYGFNKSHSAAYACIVYQTAFLKANYTTEYMCALLNSGLDKTERLIPFINACHSMKVEILGPDINESDVNFKVIEKGVIRFGLGGIKNVGVGAVKQILEIREKEIEKKFISFYGFLNSIVAIDSKLCNRRMLEALIQSGAFLSLGYKRKSLFEAIDIGINYAQKNQNDSLYGQSSLFGDNHDTFIEAIPKGPTVGEFNENEILTMEKELLGFYLTGHPLSKYARKLKHANIPTIENLSKMGSGIAIEVAVVLSDFHKLTTRSKEEMCRLQVEDMSDACEAIVLPAVYKKFSHKIKKGALLMLSCFVEKKEDTGTLSLRVTQIKDLDSNLIDERLEKSLHIKIWDKSPLQDIHNLKMILSANKGPLNVYFHILEERAKATNQETHAVTQVIKTHESFNISFSENLCTRLSGIGAVNAIDLSIGDKIVNKYKFNS